MKPSTKHTGASGSCDRSTRSVLGYILSQFVRKSAGSLPETMTVPGPNPAVRQLLMVLVAPLFVLGTTVRAQDESVPLQADEVTAPAQAAADPTTQNEASATEVPAGDESSVATETSPASNEVTDPADQASAPAADEMTPATDAVTSTEPESAPAPESNESSPEAAAPVTENVATVTPDAPDSAQEEVAPVAETETPPAEPAPTPDPVAPVEEAVAQTAPDASAPVMDSEASSAPVADTIIPATAEAAAAPEPAAPAEEPAAPESDAVTQVAEQAPAPVQETPAAVQEEVAPVAEMAAPEPAEPAAEPTTPSPENIKHVAQEEVQEAPAAMKEEVSTVAETDPTPPAPAPDATVPSPDAVTPVADTVAEVAAETPAPVSETPEPTAETPALTADATSTDQTETTAPVGEAPVPTAEEPALAADAALATPAEATLAPEAETPSIIEEAVAQTPTEDPTVVQEPVAQVPATDSGVAVDRFAFSYGLAHPALPSVDELNSMSFAAARNGNVFSGPAAGGAESLTLGNIPVGSRFDADALRTVAQEVVRWYNSRGLYGVWVTYRDIEASAAGLVDNRSLDDARVAHLVVWASQISEVRTLARGSKRIKPQFSINNRKHRGIVKRSPLRPGSTIDQPGSLFNQEVLNEYLYGLSLHPGRRVEASIASAGEPGKVVLDYLVRETKTWQIFSQVNNYGTESTGEFRVRVGFQHNQLTNHDDILNVDVISTPDMETYGAFLSYRIPLWRPAKVLMRIYGSYGDFLTLNNDSALVNLRYAGLNWMGGIEFMNRTSLWQNWQLQSVIGANFSHYEIQQSIGERPLGSRGSSDFLVPFIGTTLSKDFRWGGVSGGLRFDHTVGDYANLDGKTGIDILGRRKVDPDWTSARWNLNGTFFLEPLFSRSNRIPTLAHEVSVRLKGRVLLRGERLIPHEQEPLGGALSVRGYAESVLSADEFVAGTIEYSYHIPRALKPGDEGSLFRRPFKWRPREVGMSPDWDLVLRAFFDYAYRGVNPAALDPNLPPPEPDAITPFADRNLTIAGTGIGVGLNIRQNFTLRADFGMALTELKDPQRPDDEQIISPSGNKQLHFSSSFSW